MTKDEAKIKNLYGVSGHRLSRASFKEEKCIAVLLSENCHVTVLSGSKFLNSFKKSITDEL